MANQAVKADQARALRAAETRTFFQARQPYPYWLGNTLKKNTWQ
jgi:hypothetical protein